MVLRAMGILRFLLAMSVAIGHGSATAGRFVVPGDTAVQVFFAISGFYMALVLNEKYKTGIVIFYANRAMRLLPLYWVVLVVSVAALGFSDKAVEGLRLEGAIVWVYTIISQIFLIGQDLTNFLYFPNGVPYFAISPVPPAWTLGTEIAFYLIAPFIVRRSVWAVAVLLLASVALRLAMQFGFGLYGDPWSYRFFPSELALFLAGVIGYRAYRSTGPEQRRNLHLLVATVGIIAVALLLNRWNGVTRVASVTFLAASIVSIPFLFRLTRDFAWDNYIGNLSYPIYILHYLFARLITDNLALYVGVVLVASVAAYRFIDQPIDNWRHTKKLAPQLST